MRLILLLLVLIWPNFALAQKGSVTDAEWQAYKTAFVRGDGRVVDNANGGISHSESQGYGLLLAVFADDPVGFAQIWSFTRTSLLIRDDGLAAWKWDEKSIPHLTDINNATDGDILIAYALKLASDQWQNRDYRSAAEKLARAIEQITLKTVGKTIFLMPATQGFDEKDREDGPVVNLSYWIFEAWPALKNLAPSDRWNAAFESGSSLLDLASFGPQKLPPEWLSLKGPLRPAKGFPPQFGYNAIRVPLYLVRAGMYGHHALQNFREAWRDRSPVAVDLASGSAVEPLEDAGYRAVAALVFCAAEGTKFPNDLKSFSPKLYYPATLHLLSLSAARVRHPQCL